MARAAASLSEQISARRPVEAGGASGNTLERVTLRDGRELILKRVSPEWDWLSRATGDGGRACVMWEAGLFDRIPAVIEHGTVAVERDGPAWNVFMRDLAGSLFADDARPDRDDVRRVLAATAELHTTFWGAPLPELCSLEDRYRLLSPHTAERERGTHVGKLIDDSWEVMTQHAPSDITDIARRLLGRSRTNSGRASRPSSTATYG